MRDVLSKVNEGFEAGIITKSHLANYVFENLERLMDDSDVKSLRVLHFDDHKMLNSLLKNTGDTNQIPDELKRVLREHYGISERDKKRGPKRSN